MKKIKKNEFLIATLRIALPIAFQDLISLTVNLIDGLMIGTLGEAAISGVSFTTKFVFLISTLCSGLSGGAQVIGTQAAGKEDYLRIKKVFATVLRITVVLGTLLCMAAAAAPGKALALYTEDKAVMAASSEYLSIIAISMLPGLISRMMLMLLQITGNIRVGVYNSLLSCVLNTFLNYLLIFGNMGFSAMGVQGAAIATLTARCVEMVVFIWYLLFAEKKLSFKISDLRLHADKNLLKMLLVIGLPILGSEVINSLNTTIQAMMIGRVGTSFVAANSLVHNSYQITQVFVRGFGSAATILTGIEIGKNDDAKIQKLAGTFICEAVVLGLLSSLTVLASVPILGHFYVITDDTRRIAREMSWAASVTVLCVSLQEIVTRGVLKAGGKSRIQMRVDMISSWLIGIPAAAIAVFVLKAPAFWIYLSIRISYIIKAVWGIWYVRRKKWYIQII